VKIVFQVKTSVLSNFLNFSSTHNIEFRKCLKEIKKSALKTSRLYSRRLATRNFPGKSKVRQAHTSSLTGYP
jgi:hypothetical protein